MTITWATPRNRRRLEVGKGVEALRHEECGFTHSVSGALTMVNIIGPFETDIDVKDVVITAGTVPTDNASNAVDVFNGTVAGANKIITTVDPDGLTIQVPSFATLDPKYTRVLAGTPISVRCVFGGDDSTTPASVYVRIGYDIPLDGYATSRITVTGGYDGNI